MLLLQLSGLTQLMGIFAGWQARFSALEDVHRRRQRCRPDPARAAQRLERLTAICAVQLGVADLLHSVLVLGARSCSMPAYADAMTALRRTEHLGPLFQATRRPRGPRRPRREAARARRAGPTVGQPDLSALRAALREKALHLILAALLDGDEASLARSQAAGLAEGWTLWLLQQATADPGDPACGGGGRAGELPPARSHAQRPAAGGARRRARVRRSVRRRGGGEGGPDAAVGGAGGSVGRAAARAGAERRGPAGARLSARRARRGKQGGDASEPVGPTTGEAVRLVRPQPRVASTATAAFVRLRAPQPASLGASGRGRRRRRRRRRARRRDGRRRDGRGRRGRGAPRSSARGPTPRTGALRRPPSRPTPAPPCRRGRARRRPRPNGPPTRRGRPPRR